MKTTTFLLAVLLALTVSCVVRAEPVQGGLPLSAWAGMLRHPHSGMRERAVTSLAALGSAAAPASSALVDLLDDPEDGIRQSAVTALGKLGPAAVPSLRAALRDPRTHVRELAARALGPLAGADSSRALTDALRDPEATVRLAAAEGLLKQLTPSAQAPPAVAATLIALLERQEPELVRGSLRLLAQAGPAASAAVPALRRLLRARDRSATDRPLVRQNLLILEALPCLGPEARAAIPEVTEILTQPIPPNLGNETTELMRDQRVGAAAVLLAFGVEKDRACTVLVEELEFRLGRNSSSSSSAEQRQRKIRTLLIQGRLPPPGQPLVAPAGPAALSEAALGALSRGLLSREDAVRAGSLQVLSCCSNVPAGWLPRLRQLADEDVAATVRRWAVALLGCQGAPLAREDFEELIAGLELPGGWQRRGRFNTWTYDWRSVVLPALVASAPASVPHLVRALEAANPATREGAAETLARMARSDRPEMRAAARQALPALKKCADQGLPTLFTDWAAVWAALALAPIREDRQASLQGLLKARERLHLHQHGLLTARGVVTSAPERVAGPLREALVEMGELATVELSCMLSPRSRSREAALEMLAELAEGGKVPSALRVLLSALDAPFEQVRLETVAVLRRLPETHLRAFAPALRRALSSSSSQVRVEAGWTLSQLNEERDRVRAILLQLVLAHEGSGATRAPAALVEIGAPAAMAPDLLRIAANRHNDPLLLHVYFRAAPEPLGPLAALLENSEQRIWAVDNLAELGPAVVPVLQPALSHASPEVRRAAVEVMRRLGLGGRTAAPRLQRLLRDPDPGVGLTAAAALCAMHQAGEEVMPILLAGLAGGDSAGRELAASSLGYLGERAAPAVPALRRALAADEPAVRRAAALTLGQLGAPAAVAVADMVTLAVREGDNPLRSALLESAEAILREHPDDSPAAVRAVLALLDHPDEEVRGAGASMLNRFRRDRVAPLVLPRLIPLLLTPGDSLCSFAENYVRSAGLAGVPYLVPLLNAPHPEVRRRAAQHLGNSSEERPAALLLLGALGDPEEEVRVAACEAFHGQERYLDLVLPALARRLECASKGVRVAAARTLATLGARARPAVPLLCAQAGAADDAMRAAVAHALTRIGGLDTPAAVALFSTLVRDPAAEVREKAIEALASLGPAGLPGLRQALEDSSPVLRKKALAAVANISSLPADLEPALSRLLHDPDPTLRGEAAATLAGLGPAAAPALPVLAPLLGDEDAGVRSGAAQALGAVGPPASALAPALKALLRDPQEKVRRAAAEALDRVGPVSSPRMDRAP
jgi:HEAT repeat protein